MRRLLLLRHAKAEPPPFGDQSDAADHDRPLTPQGLADAAALGAAGLIQAEAPALALISSARRTRETFAALDLTTSEAAVAPAAQFLDTLFLAEPATLLQVLREVPGALHCVLLVGHNPGLHSLAHLLARGSLAPLTTVDRALDRLASGLPACGLVVIELEGSWDQLGRSPPLTRLAGLRAP